MTSAIHVTDDLQRAAVIRERFARQLPGVPLIVVESPFRSLVRPLVRYLEDAAATSTDDIVIVLLPEYVPRHRWERFLYNDNARRIQQAQLGRQGILVAAVPFRREA